MNMQETFRIRENLSNSLSFMTIDEIVSRCPAANVSEPHPYVQQAIDDGRSQYTCIPLPELLEVFSRHGMGPVRAYSANPRAKDTTYHGQTINDRLYCKHVIEFGFADEIRMVGRPLSILKFNNAHDMTWANRLLAAIIELQCMNGSAIDILRCDNARVVHKNVDLDQYKIGLDSAIGKFNRIHDIIGRMQEVTLSPREQLEYAEQAALAFYPGEPLAISDSSYEGISVSSLLKPMFRYQESNSNYRTVYQTWQTVQSRAIQHGGAILIRRKESRRVERVTKGFSQLDKVDKMNMFLFALANKFMESVTGPALTHSMLALPNYETYEDNRDILGD
jgi:hypothetical protein